MNEKLISELFQRIMSEGLGLDLSDPNLKDTPDRVARMYCQDFFNSENPKLTIFPNRSKCDEIIMVDNIPFVSICAHHFLPFSGLAWLLYIPDKYLIGASKASRLINYYCSTPQNQEELTENIVIGFNLNVEPKGTMLVMRAVHDCMFCRGVKTGRYSGLTTSKRTGSFEVETTKNEGLKLIELSLNMR